MFSKEDRQNGQQVYRKMLTFTNYLRNAHQNYNEVAPHTGCWQQNAEKGTFVYCCWEYEVI